MNNINYHISEDEKNILSENVGGIIADIRNEHITPDELQNIARLLEINKDNFDNLNAETWFRKAWLVMSGKRGKLADISINNLGKIQLGILKLLAELMEDTAGIKDDFLMIFGRLNKLQQQSIDLKIIILEFNKKYKKRFRKLQLEIEETRWSLRLSQVVLGLGCILGGALMLMPSLKEEYWQYGVAGGLAIGIFLIGQFVFGFNKRKRMPIPIEIVKKIEITSDAQNSVESACNFLKVSVRADHVSEVTDNRIFKVDNKVVDLMDYFNLSDEEQRLLFSLEYYLAKVDCTDTDDSILKSKKEAWLEAWRQIIEERISGDLVTDWNVLSLGLNEVRQEHLTTTKIGTILFETSIFTPYFPLGSSKRDEELIYSLDSHQSQVNMFCSSLGFASHLIEEVKIAYETALKEISEKGFFDTVCNGIKKNPLAPLAGAILIALTGGLGMAGGTAVIIGGGTILGAGTSSGLIAMFSEARSLLLMELAKMEAIAKVFIQPMKNSKKVLNEIIKHEKKTFKKLTKARERYNTKGDKKKVEELDEGIRMSDKAIERLECIVSEQIL